MDRHEIWLLAISASLVPFGVYAVMAQ